MVSTATAVDGSIHRQREGHFIDSILGTYVNIEYLI